MNKKEDEKFDKYDSLQDKMNKDRNPKVKQKVSGKSVFELQKQLNTKSKNLNAK